jgi:endonuclease YncB( thermonuclease family)
MRKDVVGFAVLVALAVAAGGLGARWRVAAEGTAAPAMARVAVALPSTPAATQAMAVVAVPPAPAPPAAPKDSDADLSVVDVPARAVHEVPADAGAQPAPAVSFVHRAAVPDERVAYAPPPRPLPRHAPKRHQSVATLALPLAGAARPADGASLTIDGMTVRLFGVKPAGSHDRCGADASCYSAARGAMAVQLARDASVRCVVPPGQEGAPAYVCHDSAGVDLGGFLVAQGLALADTSRSYQYVGAQDGARGARQGLWAHR